MFSRKANGMTVLAAHPLIGEKASMRIEATELSKLDISSLVFDLVNDFGQKLQSLTHKGFVATFDLPSTSSFRVRMSGKTSTGRPFQRMSKGIAPKLAAIRPKMMNSIFSVKRNVRSPFTAVIDYLGKGRKKFAISVTCSIRAHLENKYSMIVTSGRPAEVRVHVTVPSDTPVHKIILLQIQAKSGDLVLDLSTQLMVT